MNIFIFHFTMAYKRSGYAKKATKTRQKAARAMQRRMFRSAATTRNALRYNRILAPAPRNGRPEVKMVDNMNGESIITQALNTTGTLNVVNLIRSGSGFNQRIGRRIEMKSLHLTGLIKPTGVVNPSYDMGRILVVYDRQPNGAVPTIAQILLSYDQGSATSTNALSFTNPDQRERFMILMDERIALPSYATSTGLTGGCDGPNKSFLVNRFINLAGLRTQYGLDSSVAAIGDIASGALYVLSLGSFASGTAAWTLSCTWRLRYQDN